ncbi:hypothetical protein BIWAKO_05148 [Bosea sp. BIWAKO-01]|nr:hypothetical protein BIWAKO_05148 [Bosea sp. BIWAKO-01]
MSISIILVALALSSFAALGCASMLLERARLKRTRYIHDYAWPPGLLDKLTKHHPSLCPDDVEMVSQGLRQFFRAYLGSGSRYVAMPSQVADDLWHEFILYTRDYQAFCRRAFGGFLHHTPAAGLSEQHTRSNEGLRRVWRHCCREEEINTMRPDRLPLLFALDIKLSIPNGFYYHPDCTELRCRGEAGVQCGGDFATARDTPGGSGCGGGGCGGDSGCGGGGGD